MAHNVPAVSDVLPARIGKCVAFPGLAKCGGVSRGNEVQRNDLGERSLAAERRRYAYSPVMRRFFY
jgi:hypothetical protein